MTPRRTSGEIVNATLLEIFLALVFLVLVVAWSESVSADEARTAVRESTGVLVQVRGEVRRQGQQILGLRFNSRFPPFCEPADSALFLTIGLGPRGALQVLVRESKLGFQAGQSLTVSADNFTKAFRVVYDSSLVRGCRYRVRVIDAFDVSKDDYKRALSKIVAVFYPVGAYQ